MWTSEVEASIRSEIAFSIVTQMAATTLDLSFAEIYGAGRLPRRVVPYDSLTGPSVPMRILGKSIFSVFANPSKVFSGSFPTATAMFTFFQRCGCHGIRMHGNENHPAKSLGNRGSGWYPSRVTFREQVSN